MATFRRSEPAESVRVQSGNGSRRRARARNRETLFQAHGVIHPRVHQVGPDHFGIVAVERTGRYHHVPQRAFRDAGFDTRVVHSYTSKQYRQPADPDNKTDDTDRAAILRAGVGGFALVEPEWDEAERELQLVVRQRRDLVKKCAALQCQVREHLDAALPGYAACFDKLWESPVALPLARHAASADAIRSLGHDAIVRWLRERKLRFFDRTIDRVLAWAARAAAPDQAAARHAAIAWALDDDPHRRGPPGISTPRDARTRLRAAKTHRVSSRT